MGIWVGSEDDKAELYVGAYRSYDQFIDDLCTEGLSDDPGLKLLRRGPVWSSDECIILYLCVDRILRKKIEKSRMAKTWNWLFYYFQVIEPEEEVVRDDIVKFREGLKYCAETGQGTVEL